MGQNKVKKFKLHDDKNLKKKKIKKKSYTQVSKDQISTG